MAESSSGNNRNRSGGGNRNRNRNSGGNRNRSGGNRGGNRSEDRSGNRSGGGNRGGNRSGGNRSGGNRSRRRPEPKPTGWQKFVKAITFGLVDPTKKKKKPQSSSQPAKKRPGRIREVVEPTTPRLYVGNLSYDVDNEALKEYFSSAGTVVEAAVVMHSRSGKSKGFAFVEMSSLEEAKVAAIKLNDTDLMGRRLLVTGAKSEKRKEGEGGERPRRERSGERRSEGRGEGRRERGSRDRDRDRDRRGGRGGRSGDKPERASRQVKPLQIEQVSNAYLQIKNLNVQATDQDFADLFEGVGSLKVRENVSPAEGADTYDLRVEMASTEDAQKAVEFLHGKSFMGNQLKVTGTDAFDADAPAATEAPVESAPEPAAEQPVSEPATETAPEEAAKTAREASEPAPETGEAPEAAPAPEASDDDWRPGEEEPKEG